MGAVYLVTDQQLQRPAALKVSVLEDTPVARERFLREGRAQGKLKHPSLLEVYDCGIAPEGAYLVTEYLTGASLAELLDATEDRSSSSYREKVRATILEVAEALEIVHAAGLVHRDVKPSNIMVPTDGPARLVDFGLVLTSDLTRLTETKQLVGTVATMAPEVLRGAPTTPAADWFGLGATLFHACEGRPWRSWTEAILLLDGGTVPSPEFRILSRESGLAQAILALTHDDPDRRLAGSRPLRDLLTLASPDVSPERGAGRRLPLGLPLAGMALLAVAGLSLGPGPSPPPTPSTAPPPPTPTSELARVFDRLNRDLRSLGSGSRLSGDPAEVLDGRFPGFAAVEQWRRQNPAVTSLQEPVATQARRIDSDFMDQGFPRPFVDIIAAPSRPEPRDTPDAPLIVAIARKVGPPVGGTGDWARAMALLEKAEVARQTYIRSIEGDSGAPPLPRDLQLYSTYGLANLNETAQAAQAKADGRSALVTWMRDGTAAFRRGLLLARSAIREAPRDLGERMALFVGAVVDRQEVYGLGEFAYLDPWAPPPSVPAEAFLVALWSRQASEGRRIARRHWRPLLLQGNQELELLLREGNVGPELQTEAAGLLLANWTRLADKPATFGALERHLDRLMVSRRTQAIAANAGELCWDLLDQDPNFRERFLGAVAPRLEGLSKIRRRYPRVAVAVEVWLRESRGRRGP
jgi:serine/threonine protein kinase